MNKLSFIFFRVLMPALVIFTMSVYGAEPELLKLNDINKVMDQIFKEHVDKKEISDSILKNSFKVYIDQFDPDRTYLLESEVQPYLDPSNTELHKALLDYKTNNYSVYVQLNDVIQKAILRARAIRGELEKNPDHLFLTSQKVTQSKIDEWNETPSTVPFPRNEKELRNRIKNDLEKFIYMETRRYGEAQISRNVPQVLSLYDQNLVDSENQYLYRDANGRPASTAEQQNMFTMHVLKSLAKSLDAHTEFFSPSQAYDMKVRLEKEYPGIGVILSQAADGSVVITELISGGPAAKSGLVKPSDKVIEIDGKKVIDLPLDQVMDMMRGKNGSTISLLLKREVNESGRQVEKQFSVKLKREEITLNDDRVDVKFEKFGNGIIGVISLHSFYQGDNGVTAVNDVRNAIKKLDKEGNLRGLILDLRDNSGGFLSQSVKVAGLFISDGIVVISKYFNGEQHFYRDIDNDEVYKGPLIVLTSRATASAAEIVAQALQDYGVALIVGDLQTYGKGTIQSQTVTEDGSTSYFKVTVGKYYTVSGKTPQINGVKADIVVPSKYSNERIGEKYLESALPTDSIAPEYQDPLTDVDPGLKPWYMHYYVPRLQHKEDTWRNMIPTLKKNSEYRLAHNKNFQMFLKHINGTPAEEETDNEDLDQGPAQNNFGSEDVQLNEAVNILKDMVFLENHAHGGGTMEYVGQPAAAPETAGK